MTLDPRQAILESFCEHMQICGMCTLTWSDDFCDDFKEFLKMYSITIKPWLKQFDGWTITYLVEAEDMPIGAIHTVNDQLGLKLLKKYAKDLTIEEEEING